MAALCERLSRSVAFSNRSELLAAKRCVPPQRLPCLSCRLGSSKIGVAGRKSCNVPTAQTMTAIIRPFVSEAAMIIELAHMR
jgi:hypothetical protein